MQIAESGVKLARDLLWWDTFFFSRDFGDSTCFRQWMGATVTHNVGFFCGMVWDLLLLLL